MCADDGTRLSGVDILDEDTPSALCLPEPGELGPGSCGACGAPDADDGDGYCQRCGHRLGQPTTPLSEKGDSVDEPPATSLRPGLTLGEYTVLGPAARYDARATTRTGNEVLMVLGTPDALTIEAEVLGLLAGKRAYPLVIERGKKAPLAYLALSAPPASMRKLGDVMRTETPAGVVRAIAALLDVAEEVELLGYAFHPAPRDLLLAPDGSVALTRVRSASRGRTVDARRLLESLSDMFLAPAILGPTKLVRLLVPSRDSEDSDDRSIAGVREELRAVEADLAMQLGCAGIAELCDQGLWRPYNQDATALDHGLTVAGDPFAVLVVCDGVSSSAYSELASSTAARTACLELAEFARSAAIAEHEVPPAVSRAIRSAHRAICDAHAAEPVSDLPGTTIVVGLIYKKRLTMGWVGDSRGYWLTSRGAELLTHDHSWVNEAIARGEVKHAAEVQGALAHTITRCLGPLEVGELAAEVEPDVRSRDLVGPGLVLLCTDGLWNYTPEPDDLARVMRSAPDETNAVSVARLLVNYALARGGQDNVSVAVYAHA